jgi:predicted TIM-barrel fold metal-dependent hydrolase
MQKQLPGDGVTVFDESGALTPEAVEVVRLVADAEACLATGHLSIAEIRALLDAATANGVTKFLVTHANWALCRLELDVQRELIAAGAYLEYVAVSCCSPIFWEQKPDELAEWIEALGGDRLVLSSDLGQASAPPHAEGMRMLLRSLLDVGASADELEKMTKANPATLLGLSH